IPLLFNLVPRNGFYGIRTREAMASDADWYAMNRFGGVVLIVASLVWIVAVVYARSRFVKPIGVAAVLISVGIILLAQAWVLG
ncbi:MAG: SdpI family protein, partial [Vicinamibacterales bacterium]